MLSVFCKSLSKTWSASHIVFSFFTLVSCLTGYDKFIVRTHLQSVNREYLGVHVPQANQPAGQCTLILDKSVQILILYFTCVSMCFLSFKIYVLSVGKECNGIKAIIYEFLGHLGIINFICDVKS